MQYCPACGARVLVSGQAFCAGCGSSLLVLGQPPSITPSGAAGSVVGETVFPSVWYLPDENRWSQLNPLAMRDRGQLVVSYAEATFTGGNSQVAIRNVTRVSYGKQGRDFLNNWVRVDFGAGETAFFMDGTALGWGGLLGGTKRILDAMWPLQGRPLGPVRGPVSWALPPQPAAEPSPVTGPPSLPGSEFPVGPTRARPGTRSMQKLLQVQRPTAIVYPAVVACLASPPWIPDPASGAVVGLLESRWSGTKGSSEWLIARVRNTAPARPNDTEIELTAWSEESYPGRGLVLAAARRATDKILRNHIVRFEAAMRSRLGF